VPEYFVEAAPAGDNNSGGNRGDNHQQRHAGWKAEVGQHTGPRDDDNVKEPYRQEYSISQKQVFSPFAEFQQRKYHGQRDC
jgi:hypothetical protein